MILLNQLDQTLTFPTPNSALTDPNGLLAFGGDLSIARLQAAYSQGIFPWFSIGDPILWWSPDPRAILLPQRLHISHSMKKFMKKTDYTVSINCCFEQVITACAQRKQGETWITAELQQAFIEMHQQGLAHSVEVWQNNELIGGLYGISQGKIFCGESMFSLKENASKYGLIRFSQHFLQHGGKLIDSQVANNHTFSLGVIEIKRKTYLRLLKKLQQQTCDIRCWKKQVL